MYDQIACADYVRISVACTRPRVLPDRKQVDQYEEKCMLRRRLVGGNSNGEVSDKVEEVCAFHINPLPDTLAVNGYNGYRF